MKEGGITMKLQESYETEFQEFKISLSELDKGILSLTAMLNKHGKGKIYFGVNNSGEILGLDKTVGQEIIRKIGIRISEQVRPAIVPKITIETFENKIIIVLEAEGYNKPYSASGEYRIRIGTENKKIDPSVISELVLSNSITQMENIESLNQNLTFEQLKGLYISHGLTVDDSTFCSNMGLLTKKGTYNYLADILSDNNNCSIKVARFKGVDKEEMITRNEFGYKCLLISMKAAFNYVSSLNEVRVDLNSGLERKETPLFDINCFDEAWTNACLHNKWTKNVPPAIYIFDNRIEIISTGGLPYDFSINDFFAGISRPVNVGLQKIMGQLDMIEQTGHGVPMIVKRYGPDIFNITDNYIIVSIPFAFDPSFKQTDYEGLTISQKKLLTAIKNNPTLSIPELSKMINLGQSRVSVLLRQLKESGKIERIGKTKGGYWIVK